LRELARFSEITGQHRQWLQLAVKGDVFENPPDLELASDRLDGIVEQDRL
jgi:hypothetical protein